MSVVLTLCLCSGAGSSAAQMKTSYACQDTRLDLRCPAGEVIKVGAKYYYCKIYLLL